MVFQKKKSSTDDDLRKKFNIEECYVLLKPLNLKICQIRYKDQPQESSSKKCCVTNSDTVPKRCKISIKSSAIIENMKLDFDNIPPNQLLVKDIKAAFSEVSEVKELNFLALRYVVQRILEDAKRRNLYTVFYQDPISQWKGSVEEEPAEMYILVDEGDLSSVKKALVSRPIVKINRISTRKRTFSESNYAEIPESVGDQEKKKRLKIGNKESIYVPEKDWALAMKAFENKLTIPILMEALKKHMNEELNEFQDGRGNLEEAQSSSDTVGILPDVSHEGELLTIQNTDASQEMVNVINDPEEEMIFEIESLKKPYSEEQSLQNRGECISSSSQFNPLSKVNYDLLDIGPCIDEEEEVVVPAPLMETDDMGPYIDEPEEEVPAPLMEKDDMGQYIDEPEEEVPAPLMETDDMGPYIDEPEEEEVPAPLMETDDKFENGERQEINEGLCLQIRAPTDTEDHEQQKDYKTSDISEEYQVDNHSAINQNTNSPQCYSFFEMNCNLNPISTYIDEEEVPQKSTENNDPFKNCMLQQMFDEFSLDVSELYQVSNDTAINQDTKSFLKVIYNVLPISTSIEEEEDEEVPVLLKEKSTTINEEVLEKLIFEKEEDEEIPLLLTALRKIIEEEEEEKVPAPLTETDDNFENGERQEINEGLCLQIRSPADTGDHEHQKDYKTSDISEEYQVDNHSVINQNTSSPQSYSFCEVNCNFGPISTYIDEEILKILTENNDPFKNCILEQMIDELSLDVSELYPVSNDTAIQYYPPNYHSFLKVIYRVLPISAYIEEKKDEELPVLLKEKSTTINDEALEKLIFEEEEEEEIPLLLTALRKIIEEDEVPELRTENNINKEDLPENIFQSEEAPELRTENNINKEDLPENIFQSEKVPEPVIGKNIPFNELIFEDVVPNRLGFDTLGIRVISSIGTEVYDIDRSQLRNNTALNRNTDSLIQSKTLAELFPDISGIDNFTEDY